MTQYAYLIPIFPFIAFLLNIFFGARIFKEKAAWVSVVSSLMSCAVGLPCAAAVAQSGTISAQMDWLSLGSYTLSFGYLLDPWSATMLFVVTIVGTLIQIYAAGYMHGDPRFSRFFAYVSLFMAAMLTLVISNNYILFFMAWEVMGLCSYLLIGFWFEKDSAANASRKAFLTTRVGDVGFFIGILTLFKASGTLNFADLAGVVGMGHGAHHEAVHLSPLLPVAALLIFCGTIGKSAQFPLHVWLPDAMEGPTPVSALIHAATMVAAGVFLVARSFPIFAAFPNVMFIVALIGTITAVMAAFIGLTATDIKKVLAYSTISQLGFMVAAMGFANSVAGIFHLMTHAYFKALLFMGAGSVIHGTHTQDLREMGGLFKSMKHTATTFIIGSIAIAGVPPLAGFWSKDEILASAFASGNWALFSLLLITAFMTAFYMFRLVFMAFFGEPRNHKIHAHESPAVMTAPLWVLAIGAVVLGIPGSPLMGFWLQGFLHGPDHHVEHHINVFVMTCSIVSAVCGIGLAYLMYLKNPSWAKAVGDRFKPLYNLSYNKFWFDEIYTAVIIRPFQSIAQALFRLDQQLIDGAVNGAGSVTLKGSAIKNWIDKYIVDGIVNFFGYLSQFISAVLRLFQTGIVSHYLLMIFLGVLYFIVFELR